MKVADCEIHSEDEVDVRIEWNPEKSKHKLGTGKYSTVFRGKFNNVEVAIKRCTKEQMRLFEADATMMQSGIHPNILRLLHVAPKQCLVVMEMALCSLADFLHKFDSLALERAKTYKSDCTSPTPLLWKFGVIHDIASALYYLHNTAKLLHRNIKSSNVLLFRDPASGRTIAKLSDVHTSQTTEECLMQSISITSVANKVPVESWCYNAPEIFRRIHTQKLKSEREVDRNVEVHSQASDVYSFGVLINELMHESLPWPNKVLESEVRKWVVLEQRRPELWTIAGDISNNDDVTSGPSHVDHESKSRAMRLYSFVSSGSAR